MQGNETVSRAAELEDDYGHCRNNSIEDAVMGIMSDVISHCFKDEVSARPTTFVTSRLNKHDMQSLLLIIKFLYCVWLTSMAHMVV